tara:strand:- start:10991 stop:12103 length:1113 start_codon:yes stop_codon:yes gene_type:complete
LNKPTILFLIDGLQTGGAERSLLELCKRFIQLIPTVGVLSNSLELKPEFDKHNIPVFSVPIPRNYRFRRNSVQLRMLVDTVKPDIIHSFLFHADMTLRYLEFRGPKVTGLVSNSYSRRRLTQVPLNVAFKVILLKFWDRFTASKIDFFIANSEVIREAYIKELSYKSGKVAVIYRGRKIDEFKKKNKSSEYKFQLNIISVGRLVPSKGFIDLLEAFSLFQKENRKVTLTICGEGPQRQELEKLIRDMELSSTVKLVGSVDDIPDRLRNSDLFVFPTYYEGLPGSIIEAMLSGIPIICSDIPENKECLKDGMCLFHRVGDAQDLFEKMKEANLLTDWDIRTEKAYQYASKHFDIDKIANQYEETYLKLLNS